MRKWLPLWVCMFMSVLNLFAGAANYHGWDDCWYLLSLGFAAMGVIVVKRIQYHEDIGEE